MLVFSARRCASNGKRTVPRCTEHTHTHTTGFDQLRHFMYCVWFIYFFLRFVWSVVCQVVFCWCRLYFPSQSTNLKISPSAGSMRIEYSRCTKAKVQWEWFVCFGWGRAHKIPGHWKPEQWNKFIPMRNANCERKQYNTHTSSSSEVHCIPGTMTILTSEIAFYKLNESRERGATKTIAARPVTRAAHWSRLCHTKYIYIRSTSGTPPIYKCVAWNIPRFNA